MKNDSSNMFTQTNITTTNGFTWANRTNSYSFTWMDIPVTNGLTCTNKTATNRFTWTNITITIKINLLKQMESRTGTIQGNVVKSSKFKSRAHYSSLEFLN